jgi:hypothetical protein
LNLRERIGNARASSALRLKTDLRRFEPWKFLPVAAVLVGLSVIAPWRWLKMALVFFAILSTPLPLYVEAFWRFVLMLVIPDNRNP